jgi:hypothetical protein
MSYASIHQFKGGTREQYELTLAAGPPEETGFEIATATDS